MNSSGKENIKAIFVGSYNPTEILSGPEKVTKRIFQEYSKYKETILISYFQDGRKFGYWKKIFGYSQLDTYNNNPVLMLGIFRMLILFIKIKPKYIHILSFNRFTVFLYLLKVFYLVKIFYTVNGVIIHENQVYNTEKGFTKFKNKFVENIIMYYSDRIFVLSEFSKSLLLKYYKLNRYTFSKVPNGLDECFIKSQVGRYEDKLLNSVVFIGDVYNKEKGFEFLINSLTISGLKIKLYVIAENKPVIYEEVGDNIELIFLQKMNSQKLIEFFSDKNLIISPSECDSFNISVLEAIACGLAPIITKQTGINEYLSSNFSSSIINFGDFNALVRLLVLKTQHYTRYENDFDANNFSWGNVFNKYYLKHYIE